MFDMNVLILSRSLLVVYEDLLVGTWCVCAFVRLEDVGSHIVHDVMLPFCCSVHTIEMLVVVYWYSTFQRPALRLLMRLMSAMYHVLK